MEEPVWATVHEVTKSQTQLSDFPLTICLVLSSGRSQFITRVGNLSRVSILHINVNWDIHFVTFIRSTRSCYCGYCFCCSDAKSCPTPCDPMDCSIPGFPVHNLPEFAQTHVHWLSDAIQSSHALFPPSPPAFNLILASGSNESALRIKRPEYWSFSFSISPSNSGLISFRID